MPQGARTLDWQNPRQNPRLAGHRRDSYAAEASHPRLAGSNRRLTSLLLTRVRLAVGRRGCAPWWTLPSYHPYWAGAAARLGGRYLVITPIGQARLRALVDGLAALKGAGMEAREAELMAEAEALTLTLSLTLSLALTPSP